MEEQDLQMRNGPDQRNFARLAKYLYLTNTKDMLLNYLSFDFASVILAITIVI